MQSLAGQLVDSRRRLGTIVCPLMTELQWGSFINSTQTESCEAITESLSAEYGDDVTLSECRVGPNSTDGCANGEEGAKLKHHNYKKLTKIKLPSAA